MTLTMLDLMRVLLMYTTLNVALIIITGILNLQFLKGFLACNSMLIFIFVYIFHISYPEEFSKVFKSFMFFGSTRHLMIDYIFHIIPLFLSFKWISSITIIASIFPALLIIIYMCAVNLKWIYNINDVQFSKLTIQSIALYIISLLVIQTNEKYSVWMLLIISLIIIVLLSESFKNDQGKL
jgi:hypothetical protein